MPTTKAVADSKPGPAPRKARRRDREVLDAATQVFFERGYSEATVQDVADALGMLKGSLYYYIRSKEELLHRLAFEVHDDVDLLLTEATSLPGLSALQRLQAFIALQVDYSVRRLEAIWVYYHDVDHLSETPYREVIDRRRRHEDVVRGLIEQAQADGEIDPRRDAYALSQCVFGTVVWIHRWFRPTSRVAPESLRETTVWFITQGLTGRPGSDPPIPGGPMDGQPMRSAAETTGPPPSR